MSNGSSYLGEDTIESPKDTNESRSLIDWFSFHDYVYDFALEAFIRPGTSQSLLAQYNNNMILQTNDNFLHGVPHNKYYYKLQLIALPERYNLVDYFKKNQALNVARVQQPVLSLLLSTLRKVNSAFDI